MKIFYLLILFLPGFIISGCSAHSNKIDTFADSLMSATFKPDGPGAAVLIAREGNTIYRKAFGLANLELGIPNKPEYVFEI
jgi:CubicO group peptidase (beta-lactamase class C family)